MAADQLNFGLFTYVDDNALSWNARGEDNTIIATVSGATAKGAHPRFPRTNRRWTKRHAIFQDATTFRTKTVTMYTPAAYTAAVVGTTTLALHVPGETTTVNYVCVAKNPERQPGSRQSPSLADHT